MGNQNASLWRKRVVVEGNARKGGRKARICTVLCMFTFENVRINRYFSDLPCRKWLQIIRIKWRIYLGTVISQTLNDCSHFVAVGACTVLLSWQIRNIKVRFCRLWRNQKLTSTTPAVKPTCFYFIWCWCIRIRSDTSHQSLFQSINKYHRNAHMWRGFISGDKQLRRFRVPCQPDLRSKHRQLFKRDIGVFKLKAQALVPSVVLEVGVTVSFQLFSII